MLTPLLRHPSVVSRNVRPFHCMLYEEDEGRSEISPSLGSTQYNETAKQLGKQTALNQPNLPNKESIKY